MLVSILKEDTVCEVVKLDESIRWEIVALASAALSQLAVMFA